jgi:hypothetical protein
MPRHLGHSIVLAVLLSACGRAPQPEVAPQPTIADTVTPPEEPAVDSTLEQGERSLRLALADVIRLGIARTIREEKPGLLRLEVGPGFTSASAQHNLQALFAAYGRHHPGRDEPPVLELYRSGTKIGEYTGAGLTLEGEELTRAPEEGPAIQAPPPGLQVARRGRYYLSLGAGAGAADFTCSNCNFEMSTAPSGFLAAGLRVSEGLVVAAEGRGWTKKDDRGRGTIYTAMVSAVGYILEGRDVFLSVGVGYLGFKRPVPEGTYRADALGFSTRLGADFGIGGRWALSPYVAVIGSFGSPRFDLSDNPSGIEAAIRNLQFGVALTAR